MGFGITFAPLVPTYVLWVACAVAVALTVMLILVRSRGWAVRAVALTLAVLALANPAFTREDREPLTSVVVVVVDKSPSQTLGDRAAQTEAARTALAETTGKNTRPRSAFRGSRRSGRRDRRHATVQRVGRGARRRTARSCGRRDPYYGWARA